jgi:hypothetical protein
MPNHMLRSPLKKHFLGLVQVKSDKPSTPGFTWEHYKAAKDENSVSKAEHVCREFWVCAYVIALIVIPTLGNYLTPICIVVESLCLQAWVRGSGCKGVRVRCQGPSVRCEVQCAHYGRAESSPQGLRREEDDEVSSLLHL